MLLLLRNILRINIFFLKQSWRLFRTGSGRFLTVVIKGESLVPRKSTRLKVGCCFSRENDIEVCLSACLSICLSVRLLINQYQYPSISDFCAFEITLFKDINDYVKYLEKIFIYEIFL